MATKACRDCKDVKDISEFVNNKAFSSGKDTLCKVCNRQRSALYALSGKRKRSEADKRYREKHPTKGNYDSATRRASLKNRSPSWLNREDKWLIQEVYRFARLRTQMTGIVWHVDHIIPLTSDVVCGLHIVDNLQIITARQNLIKGNSYDSVPKHWTT